MHPAASKLDLGWSDQGKSQHDYLKYVFFLRLMRSVYIEPFLDAINGRVFLQGSNSPYFLLTVPL